MKFLNNFFFFITYFGIINFSVIKGDLDDKRNDRGVKIT